MVKLGLRMAKTKAAWLLLLGAVCLSCTRPTAPEDAGPPPAASSSVAKPAPKPPRTAPPAKTAPHDGYVEMTVAGVAPSTQGNAVVLVDSDRKRALLIFIGDGEAMSITLRLSQRSFRRPLTHDLFDSALDKLDVRVDGVQVDSLRNNTFHGTLVLRERPTLALDEQGTVVSGTADLIVETAEGLWVIDHKSDQVDDPALAFEGYRAQLESYAVALSKEGNTVLGIAINWTGCGEVVMQRLQ